MKNKLAIGTVQFGLDYGISNDSGTVQLDEIKKILSEATLNSIEFIDTAKAYGTSEHKLGKLDMSIFKLITKLVNLENINNDIEDSLCKLNINTLYAVLIHDFNTFILNQQSYNDYKSSEHHINKVDKIGFSLNKISELEYLFANNIDFDIVQVPYNLLDQRFEVYFEELNSRNVEIHTRSVFLQGLFFIDINKVPNNLQKLVFPLQKIHFLANSNNISVGKLALNFVALNRYISKVVIGVTSIEELELNIEAMKETEKVRSLYKHLLDLKIDDENLVLPMNWNKNG
ncbi:MAG: aldo/keto reductase [Bacteroidales bacterium]|nr:aldo/keto reductase [Bacteroidales bacterium]